MAYLLAIPGLGPGAFFVPIVVIQAPLGIISYFDKISVDGLVTHGPAIALIHCGFWLLFLTGLMGRNTMGLPWLRAIWFTLVIMLIMSVAGCATHLGPGLRSEGNWH
ncbi:MAG: hypothetical protein V4662_04470 [Verrucomicrobiota bacterium]